MFTFSVLEFFCKFCTKNLFGILILPINLPAVYSQSLEASDFFSIICTQLDIHILSLGTVLSTNVLYNKKSILIVSMLVSLTKL